MSFPIRKVPKQKFCTTDTRYSYRSFKTFEPYVKAIFTTFPKPFVIRPSVHATSTVKQRLADILRMLAYGDHNYPLPAWCDLDYLRKIITDIRMRQTNDGLMVESASRAMISESLAMEGDIITPRGEDKYFAILESPDAETVLALIHLHSREIITKLTQLNNVSPEIVQLVQSEKLRLGETISVRYENEKTIILF